MTIRSNNGISFLISESLNQEGVTHGFFMRHGGCSPAPWKSLNMATSVGDTRENVIDNRLRLTNSLRIPSDRFYDVWQVHGNHVVSTDLPRPIDQSHIQSDAITTEKDNLYLLMLFADCVPIIIYDSFHHAVGIAHAGWKGTLNGVASSLISRMKEKYHSSPKDLLAVIGPRICRDHYPVGDEIAQQAEEKYKKRDVLDNKDGKSFFDLGLANEINLRVSGVVDIERMEVCTFCQNEDWFSHRAEKGKTGRFAAVIGLPG
ncbi:MAG: peptidoglycan editing factor PgeF [Chloroflexi bacterium]|nr:peptidoglycan editing factor PgeF [Chloroflexota bacterium]